MTPLHTPKHYVDTILKLLNNSGISSDGINKVKETLQPFKLKKGDHFSTTGKTNNKLGILISGLLIAKYESVNSIEEVVSRFYYTPRNIIVVSFESFHLGTKANETIIALEDSYLATISKQALDQLYHEIPGMNKIGKQIAEESYIQALQRIHQLQTMTVKERFQNFQKNHPELINRIQIQHLCSYLGTNRNALARLTKKRK